MPQPFARLVVTCDLPELLDALEFQARPPLAAGDVVYAYTGPTRGLLPAGCRAVQLEPGAGPWYPVPAGAVEKIPVGRTSTIPEEPQP